VTKLAWSDSWGPRSHPKGPVCHCTTAKHRLGTLHGETIHEDRCAFRYIGPAIESRRPYERPVEVPPATNRLGLRIGAFRDSV
jgi:hypothetical protein